VVPDVYATAVERMRESGAVLLAKLTAGELAIGTETNGSMMSPSHTC
jgi:Asp-tRNA(Asn)/Glu-tRNA(Gln) amidotransferase A subunit family amidase